MVVCAEEQHYVEMSDRQAGGASTPGSVLPSPGSGTASLFVPAPGTTDQVRTQNVGWWANNWAGLADSFREAAEQLCQTPMRVNSAGYAPAALLWRHHIELVLKLLYIQYLDFQDQKNEILRRHSIKFLWDKVSAQLRCFDPSLAPADFADVQATLLQLDLVDPNGEDFRYPVRAGDPETATLQGLPAIHIPTFNTGMIKASDWLRQRSEDLNAALGQKWWDMEGREEYAAEPWEPPPIDHLAGFEWWHWRYGDGLA